jgi:hypothetical protein
MPFSASGVPTAPAHPQAVKREGRAAGSGAALNNTFDAPPMSAWTLRKRSASQLPGRIARPAPWARIRLADDGRAGSACRRCFGGEIGHRPPSFPSHTENDSRDAVIERMARWRATPAAEGSGVAPLRLGSAQPETVPNASEANGFRSPRRRPGGTTPGGPWSACRPAAWQSRRPVKTARHHVIARFVFDTPTIEVVG